MRPIQLLILLVAFGAAGVAGMIAMNMATPPPQEAQLSTPSIATGEVLVATRDITMGLPVTPDAVEWRNWPTDSVVEGYITRTARPDAVSELQGTLVRDPILAGEPIREAKLIRSDRGFLSAVLPKGMRALAVRVNAASTAGGFILPNDRVDIILIRQGGGAGGTAISETILTNIRVLAIDQTIEGTDAEKKSVVVAQDTATLELTPEQAELITQAQQSGTIALSLRSVEDSEPDSEAAVRQKPTGISVVKYGVAGRISAKEPQ